MAIFSEKLEKSPDVCGTTVLVAPVCSERRLNDTFRTKKKQTKRWVQVPHLQNPDCSFSKEK